MARRTGLNGDLVGQNEHRTGDAELDRLVHQWLSWDRNPRTRGQVQALLAAGQQQELRQRLGSRLCFGTAGLRAPMGAGFSRINDLTVIQATQGLYCYLSRCCADLSSRGLVVGFDTRGQQHSGCTSERLARLTAAVMLTKDVPVFLFSSCVPTPYVPFAVMMFGATAGVMITASHNPKEDNGYKVYWCSGEQICAPHDKEVLHCMEEQQEPWSSSCWDQDLADRCTLCTDPLGPVNDCYMEQLEQLCFHRELNACCPLRFVHSAFHGVGHRFVQQAFQVFGLAPPIPVPEQQDPDPDFSSVSCPNPEEGEAVLELSMRLAEKENVKIVIATDPDADRLAVAEMSDRGQWKLFSGNELAALLGWWMWSNWQQQDHGHHGDPGQVVMLATAVSSRILKTIAAAEGFSFEETLPGFKWIGKRITELAKKGRPVIFSFEESIGFLCGSMLPDKDGISCAVVVAEMASFLHSRRSCSLLEQLHLLYTRYGYHLSSTSYVTCHEPAVVQSIFSRLRSFSGATSYPSSCGGHPVVHVRDVTTGYDSSQPDKRCVFPPTRSSHMITFTLQNGALVTLRTSGTEPKIKYYTEICCPPGPRDVCALQEELRRTTEQLVEEFLEPEKNRLIRRCL